MKNPERELDNMFDDLESTEIKDFTRKFLSIVPESFWIRESSLRHHPEDERGRYGNVTHTVRVARIARLLCTVAGLSQEVTDATTCAALSHDTFRHGPAGTSIKNVVDHPMLPRQAAEKAGITTPFSDSIFKAVESHMGKWGSPPYTPLLGMQDILVIADYIAANLQEIYD